MITRADEAEALRTAVALAHRTTVERVNDLSIQVEKASISFEAATTRALARCSRRMASNEKRYGEKFSELEQVLSAEIAARRSGAQKLAGRQMAAEDAQRQDLLEVSSRLGKQLTDMVDDVADATREMRETALRVAQGLSDLRKDSTLIIERPTRRHCMSRRGRPDGGAGGRLLGSSCWQKGLVPRTYGVAGAGREARSSSAKSERRPGLPFFSSQAKEMGRQCRTTSTTRCERRRLYSRRRICFRL